MILAEDSRDIPRISLYMIWLHCYYQATSSQPHQFVRNGCGDSLTIMRLIESKSSRRYDYHRVFCKDQTIKDRFQLVQYTIYSTEKLYHTLLSTFTFDYQTTPKAIWAYQAPLGAAYAQSIKSNQPGSWSSGQDNVVRRLLIYLGVDEGDETTKASTTKLQSVIAI